MLLGFFNFYRNDQNDLRKTQNEPKKNKLRTSQFLTFFSQFRQIFDFLRY